MSLLVLCEFRVLNQDREQSQDQNQSRDQNQDRDREFVRIARALAAAAASEPGTLRYQWFRTQRPGHYAIVEEYVDADAAETHNGNVHALLVELFGVSELVSIQFFGELNTYIRNWITGREGVAVHTAL